MYKSQLWKHLAALVYDIFPILAIFLTTSLILIMFRQGEEVQPRTLWLQAVLFLEVFLYFAYSWKLGGQTLGMRAWKIKIENHQQLTWSDVTWRFLVGTLSTVLLGLGWWTRRFNPNKLTWMDMACKQRVMDVSEKPK